MCRITPLVHLVKKNFNSHVGAIIALTYAEVNKIAFHDDWYIYQLISLRVVEPLSADR